VRVRLRPPRDDNGYYPAGKRDPTASAPPLTGPNLPAPQPEREAAVEVRDRLFIGNEWVEPATSATIDVISPTTEEVYARTPDASPADIDRAVAAARDAFDNG